MVITAGSLLTDSWNIMYNIFTDQLSDTSNLGRAGSEMVFSARPFKINQSRRTANTGDFTGKKWINYPHLVLNVEVDSVITRTINNTMKDESVIFHADIYDKSKANADKMTNQAIEILKISENGLVGSGLYNYMIESSSYSPDTDITGALVHKNTINWVYDYLRST